MADPITNSSVPLTDEEKQRLLAASSQPIIPSLHSIPPLPHTQEAKLMGGGTITPAARTGMIPQVSAYPGTPEYGEQQKAKLDYEKMFPWGTPQNHPGTWGKIGHVAGTIGNVLGQLAPSIAEAIPGSFQNRQMQERQAAGWTKLGADTQEKQAFAEKAKADVPLEQEQVKNLQSEEEARLHPKPAAEKEEEWTTVAGWQGPNGEPIQQEKHSGQFRVAPLAGASPIEKPQRAEAPHTVEMGNRTYQYDPDSKGWKDIGPAKRQVEPGNYQPVSDDKGNITGWVDPKSRNFVPAGSIAGLTQSVGGGNTLPPKPTAATQNMAQMAQTVLPMAQNLITEVNQLKGSVGPFVGRWNELLVNKGGKDFPEFAGLDTDLDLFASALVRTHFGARGGQGYREALKKQFSEAQSPEDLVARIEHADEWIRGYANMGGKGAPQPTGEAKAAPAGKKGDPMGIY